MLNMTFSHGNETSVVPSFVEAVEWRAGLLIHVSAGRNALFFSPSTPPSHSLAVHRRWRTSRLKAPLIRFSARCFLAVVFMFMNLE